ncbi:hypothetical protein ES708_22602 [subsurface metagenome]
MGRLEGLLIGGMCCRDPPTRPPGAEYFKHRAIRVLSHNAFLFPYLASYVTAQASYGGYANTDYRSIYIFDDTGDDYGGYGYDSYDGFTGH